MSFSEVTVDSGPWVMIAIICIFVAIVSRIVAEMIMNSRKKYFPVGAKISKPATVIILNVASDVLAIPLLLLIAKKLMDLVTGDRETFLSTIKLLGQGFAYSFGIFFFTVVFSIPLGLIVASGRMSKVNVVSLFFKAYISILRGTPLMLQLLLVYFGPYYLFGVTTGNIQIGPFNYRFIATIIGFSLNYAAYFAEIFRGGIQSISKGQYEAAQVLGFSKSQTYFKIILPQAVKRVLPSVANEIITLVKDTSLAQVLAVTEMFTQASALASAQVSVMPFVVAGIFYYVMNAIIEFLLGRLEKSMDYYS